MPNFLERLGFSTKSVPSVAMEVIEPKRLLVDDVKASSLSLLPKGAYGANYSFFSPDGGRTMLDITDGQTTLAFAAYWYVATRWRAQKIAEPPLMVVEEDQETGDDEWLPDHELVEILDEPSPDYDMGELLECTSHYLDNTGAALWVFDKDRIGRIARITAFSRNEFEPKGDGTRLFAFFRVNTANGQEDFDADTCAFFRDAHGTQAWGKGKSRLDVAMGWLRLSSTAQQTIYDLLKNSVWPSAVMVPDKDWNPDPETFEAYKQDLEQYAKGGNKGRPFVALGGGSFEALAASIKDLVPDEVLSRVESIVSAISGVPAIVLQFMVGMENSPWSQMEQARKMAYEDCIAPTWRKFERVLTRQMLRPLDDDPTHFMRFDSSTIASLQANQMEQVQIAVQMGRAASLNERRSVMGLEPVDPKDDPDGKANQIPELTQPSLQDILAGNGGTNTPPKPGDSTDDTKDPKTPEDDTASEDPKGKKTKRDFYERKFKAAVLHDAFRKEASAVWQLHISHLLDVDQKTIADIVESLLSGEEKSIQSKARGKERAMSAVSRFLNEESKSSWTKTMQPLMANGAERATAVVGADMNVSFALLHKNTIAFAKSRTGDMIASVSKTTKSLVSDIVQGGIDAKQSPKQIAQVIRDATGFSKSRAQLIARTETTNVFNGAPTESLKALGRDTGRTFTKTWSGVLDDKERDEHVDMEGETVAIDDVFSNGLDYPSEPNCRCTALFDETEE